jgi:probable F420-dependent oxidoreductase
MKIGIYFPSTELELTPATVREFTRAVDDMGYDYVVTADHVLGVPHDNREPRLWGPYTEHDAFLDPFVLFSHMAGISERLEFATSILVLPQRQTALVAKQAADLAVLSDNRFRLAVGVGWNHVEFAALGQDFSKRGKRMDEQVAMLRRLWSEPLVSGSVGDEVVDRAGINPRPTGTIPLWLGGYSEAALRRAARVGDGFSFGAGIDLVAPALEQLRELLVEEGRDPAEFGSELLMVAEPAEGQRGWPRDRPRYLPKTVEIVERWAELGGTDLAVTTYWMALGPLKEHLRYAEEARRLIGDRHQA